MAPVAISKKKKATLLSLLSLLLKPYYRRKPASIKIVVRIGTFWYTIRGSNNYQNLKVLKNGGLTHCLIRV